MSEPLVIAIGTLFFYIGVFTLNDIILDYFKVTNKKFIYVIYPLIMLVGLLMLLSYKNEDEDDDKS